MKINEGTLWVGTFESGSTSLTARPEHSRIITITQQNRKSLSNDSILSIYQDSKDRLWVGTAGGGLNQYHPGNRFFHLLP